MINKIKNLDKRKKRALGFLVVVIFLGVISAVLLHVMNSVEETEEEDSGNVQSYVFYTPDYNLDVTTVEEYMEKDRFLNFKYGAEEFGIIDNAAAYGRDVEFFDNYFKIVIGGKWQEYNKLFTDNYYKTEKKHGRFASQMIYDIHVEKIILGSDDDGEICVYAVTYCIYRNDGTFRNDIEQDTAKTLYFTLDEVDGELKIDSISNKLYS